MWFVRWLIKLFTKKKEEVKDNSGSMGAIVIKPKPKYHPNRNGEWTAPYRKR